jgi:hypothetical protein
MNMQKTGPMLCQFPDADCQNMSIDPIYQAKPRGCSACSVATLLIKSDPKLNR